MAPTLSIRNMAPSFYHLITIHLIVLEMKYADRRMDGRNFPYMLSVRPFCAKK
jgi:hypothetical protein